MAKKHTTIPDPAGHNHQRHAYYELHREDILADIRNLGAVATRKKWSIPPTTLYQLRTKWLDIQPPAARTNHHAAHLATLPPFNEAWPSEVKVAWLMSTAISTVASALMSTRKEAASC